MPTDEGQAELITSDGSQVSGTHQGEDSRYAVERPYLFPFYNSNRILYNNLDEKVGWVPIILQE